MCGHINKCTHHDQLNTLVSRRVATINKRSELYNLPQVTHETVKHLFLESLKSGFKCKYCNETLKLYSSKFDFRLAASIDHIIPITSGGTNDIENLVISCTRCNLVKGTMKEKHFKLFIRTLLEDGGRTELLEWLEDAYQHALAYKIERTKIEETNE